MTARRSTWTGAGARATVCYQARSRMVAFTSETGVFPSRCNASPSFFAFAVEASFVTEIWRKAFDGIGDCFIGTSVGIEDPVIGRLAALGRLELNEGGAGGRLYVEGLASALAVHLLRSSRLSRRSPIPQVWACAEADSARSTTSRRICPMSSGSSSYLPVGSPVIEGPPATALRKRSAE